MIHIKFFIVFFFNILYIHRNNNDTLDYTLYNNYNIEIVLCFVNCNSLSILKNFKLIINHH